MSNKPDLDTQLALFFAIVITGATVSAIWLGVTKHWISTRQQLRYELIKIDKKTGQYIYLYKGEE